MARERGLSKGSGWAVALCMGITMAATAQDETRWLKGNLHTHSLWSDGNGFPDMIVDRYKFDRYDFLALSDHNILSRGERWMPVSEVERRAGADAIERYKARFGSRAEFRGSGDEQEVRLRALDEFRSEFEEPGKFLLLEAEEITDALARIPVHMNATNVGELIEPQGGETVTEVIRNNLRAANEQAERLGRPILTHLNHPNFAWAITAEDIAPVVEERFFEVFNGHTGTANAGDDHHASTDQIWDIVNTLRLVQYNAPPLYGLAVDDSHDHQGNNPVSPPGRGWVMVKSRLTPESIISAMEEGEFYASTGVTLDSIDFDGSTLRLTIDGADGVRYSTKFIGTRKDVALTATDRVDANGNPIRTTRLYSDQIGEVLAEVEGTNPTFDLTGDELYVRAVVTSSRAPRFPSDGNARERAWTQPVGWAINNDGESSVDQ